MGKSLPPVGFSKLHRCLPGGICDDLHTWRTFGFLFVLRAQVWVCDFHGFGVSDLNPRLARAFLSVSAEHYPEVRAGRAS
jgi:hypothetical protein